MTTPFICRQCIARLSQSHSVRISPRRFELHAQAISTAAPQSIWSFPAEQRREPSNGYDVADNHGTGLPTYDPTLFPQTYQGEPIAESQPAWDGHFKKFIPRHRPELNKLRDLPVRGPHDLQKKILQSLGDYSIVYKDLMHTYGLSPREARHAISQLERLLGGRSAMEAGTRLEHFNAWKIHFIGLLEIVSGSHSDPGAGDDLSKQPLWTPSRKQDSEAMKEIWQRQNQTRRESLWPHIIISAFLSHLGTIPSLIRATFQSSWCPSYVVEDIVYLLSRTLDDNRTSKSDQRQVTELIFFLLKNSTPRYMVLEQLVIRKVISSLPTSKLVELHEDLKNIEHPLQHNTLLHFASRFARDSRYKVHAAEIIHFLSSRPGFDINSPAAISTCTSLLSVEEGNLPGDHAAPDELFKMLLDAGFQPNILTLSALMRNFCIRGRVEVALSIFDLLAERGIEPDPNIFSILINGAKYALDFESLCRIVTIIEARKVWSLYLVNDVLDFIYQYNESRRQNKRRQRKRDTARAWRLMVQVYMKFFKLAPLQKLTLFPLENLLATRPEQISPKLKGVDRLIARLKPLPDALLMRPDSITLALMFRVHFWTIHSTGPLRMYYNYFMKLLNKGDPIITQIIKDQGTMVFDTFLRNFMQFGSTFESGIRIVQRMHDRANQEMKKLGKNVLHPQPSVHTYTILMTGLRNHKHTRGVLVTLNMMIKEGIVPNIVTWNAVIGALLQKGYLEEAVRVMRNLKQVGLESNARTVKEITNVSKFKKKWVATLMRKLDEKPTDISDQRLFTKSLLRRWEKPDDRLIGRRSPRRGHRISHERHERHELTQPSTAFSDTA
ncbi:hypothetical protein F5Y00DRAFT_225688 [Daldinia vernicosa]|uniref:uncharacterized protein n=1 Tax=Daldinia vernicosa TaxID=114800 RepID=UPI002008A7DA|nr:uncharacterized protein F5Y00DRAFT_225688 [Daldinia vernicosa]KAI0853183.1 hypothetical protein F5Y00DRAFT_225688 [Daldinia vernicosa]